MTSRDPRAKPSAAVPSDWLSRSVGWAVRSPLQCICLWAAISLAAGVSLSHLRIDSTTSAFLDRSGPAWSEYVASAEVFGGDEFLTIAIQGSRPFDPEALNLVAELTSAFGSMPGVRRVDSVASVPLVTWLDGSLELQPVLSGSPPFSDATAADVARSLAASSVARRTLVSDDGSVFAVNVMLDRDVDIGRSEVVDAATAALGGREAWVSGVPVFRTKVNERTQAELLIFIPLTLLLVGAVVCLGFGSVYGAILSLVVSGIGAMSAIGLMAAVDVPLSLSTVTLPPILLAVGSAYMMHVLSAARSAPSRTELEGAMRSVAQPVAISGLTTAIGFLAMATVRIDAIRQLGTFGAAGVFTVLVASLTLGPAVLSMRPLSSGWSVPDWAESLLRNAILRVVAWRRTIIVAWLVFAAVFGIGIARLAVETDIILWFPKGSEIRDSYEAIKGRLSGITPVNVTIAAPRGRSVTDPEVIEKIGELTSYLEGLREVGRAISVADPLREIHAGFAGVTGGELPDRREAVEQYLLLLGSADYIKDLVAEDRHAANVMVRVDANGSRRILDLGDAAVRWWRDHGVAGYTANATGIMYEFARAEEEISFGQIRGLALAFGAIFVVLALVLRSPLIAAMALVPNTIPLVATYGAMGLAGISLDAATVCVGSVALGIAVDDTVHLVVGYREGALREDGDWLASVLGRVLRALVLTTLGVAAGFAVLTTSDFTLVRNFGGVTAAMVLLCLVADLTLLPALLRKGGTHGD